MTVYTIWKKQGSKAREAVRAIKLENDDEFNVKVGLAANQCLNSLKGEAEVMVFEKGQGGKTRWYGRRKK